jgi:DNA-binding SARP family transcriptional activator
MEFRILGPLEIVGESGPVTLSAPKARALLVLLLLRVGDVVAVDRLVDDLWAGEPPRTATASLHNLVGQLRGLLGAEVLARSGNGYVLDVPQESIDAVMFEQALVAARRAEPTRRAELLRDALALWRGAALSDVATDVFATTEARRLDALRLEATERRINAELELGGGVELVAEAEALSLAHPQHEGFRELLMRALYRAGRQAEALDAFHEARRMLVDQAGIDPGPRLQATYRAILRQELPEAQPPAPGDGAHLAAVVKAMCHGRLIVVLGPTSASSLDPRGDSSQVAALLAERFGYPAEGSMELARVSEHVSVEHGLGPLYDELHRLHDREDAASPAEHALASVAAVLAAGSRPAPLFVTAAFDESLEQALTEAGVSYDVVTYLARGSERGRFIHRGADGSARLIERPNAYTEIPLNQVVVLKLQGSVDRGSEREWESYVVSEDDHIDYLSYRDVASTMPVALLARLRRSHYLFLGYPLRDWGLRVFLHRLFARDPFAYRSWAVASTPTSIERQLWTGRGVDVVVQLPEAFAAALARDVKNACA